MRRPVLAPLLLAVLAACAPPPDGAAVAQVREPAPEWTGSETCAECHPVLYEKWRKSTHSKATRRFSDDASARPFAGDRFISRDIEFRMGPGPVMLADGPGGSMREYEIEWVLGDRRVQMFTTRLDRGRIHTLPVFIEVPKREWFDYADMIFGGPERFDIPPDSPNVWYGPLRNFNTRCGPCHVTNFEANYDPDTGIYESTWSEIEIGCEACHGAGGAHVDKWRNLTDEPEPLIDLASLDVSLANQNCGFCHSESIVIKPGFGPGDDLFWFNDVNGLEDRRHSYPDGRASELFHNLVLVMEARCGELSCVFCHDPHGGGIPGDLYHPLEYDGLCTFCHGEIAADIEAHTFHDASSEGSRCVHCHMSWILIENGHGRSRDHTLSTPSIVNTKRYAVPNACENCHAAEGREWIEDSFNACWPGAEERNHRVALAAAIGGARLREPGVEERLRPMLDDENAVYRAAATWALSEYGVDLRRMLRDDHPLVQRAAVKGVAGTHPEALVPFLDHPNPVLSGSVAEALADRREKEAFDYMRDHPGLRERVLVVLESRARMRPDRDRLHFLVAALHELSGRRDEALRSYERFLRLNPFNEAVRTHVERLRR